MFGHIFIYRIRELFRQKWCVGWNFLFPLVLATAFFVGFGNFIRNVDILTTVDVAVVETQDDEMASSFVDLVKKLDFMNVSVVDDEEAQELLKDGDVAGILYAPSFTANARQLLGGITRDKASSAADTLQISSDSDGNSSSISAESIGNALQISAGSNGNALLLTEDAEQTSYWINDPTLTVTENGVDQTILSQFLKSYIANEKEMAMIITSASDPSAIPTAIQKAADMMAKDMSFGSSDVSLRYTDDGRGPLSPYMHYFFALIAMASLFASWISTRILDETMANHSEIGKRNECAPVPRAVSLTASVLSGLVIQIISVTCLILYIQYILKLDFNAPLGYVILISAVCSATGIAFGVMFGALLGNHPAATTAVPLLFSMGCSFLSGLMVGNIQQLIQASAPWINRINPAALLTDGLDSLGSYGIGPAYWQDVLILLALTAAAIAVSSLILRRKNYASL